MKELKESMRLHRALDKGLSGLMEDPFLAGRVLAMAESEEKTVKRKVSLAAIVLIVLTLMAVTAAAAAGIYFSRMTSRMADMQASGSMWRWEFEDKQAFVGAMREAGYDMNEADYALLTDESCPLEEREAAADRIVYERFGAVQEETNATRPYPADSVMGQAPDAVEVFRERWLAENPDGTQVEYLDALGYWLRDEYTPQVQSAAPPAPEPTQPPTALTEEIVISYQRGYMTESANWPPEVVDDALFTAQEQPDGAWLVTCEAPAEALESARDPLLEGAGITRTETGYRMTMWYAMDEAHDVHWGRTRQELATVMSYDRQAQNWYMITDEEAASLAAEAVQAHFGLTDAQVKRYFLYFTRTFEADADCRRVGVMFQMHNYTGSPWDYAAIVNYTTGQVEDVFAAEELIARLPAYAAAWKGMHTRAEKQQYAAWYGEYSPFGDFGTWDLADQAAACEAFWELRAVIRRASVNKHDFYELEAFTNHHYSIPQPGETDESAAHALAVQAVAEAFNLPEEAVRAWYVERTFARDEGEPPTWRFFLMCTEDTEGRTPTAAVKINAETGEVIDVVRYSLGGISAL